MKRLGDQIWMAILWRATHAGVRGYHQGRAHAQLPAPMETKSNPPPKPSLEELRRAALRFALSLAVFLAVSYFAYEHKYGHAMSMGAAVGTVKTAKGLWRAFRWRCLADWDSEKIQLVTFSTALGILLLLGAIFQGAISH